MICATAFAQSAVTKIREEYAAAKEYVKMLSERKYAAQNKYQTTIEQRLSGSGQHKEVLTMYYYENEGDYGEVKSRTIMYATSNFNFGARKYSEEYLYDHSGKIEFIYATTEDDDAIEFFEFRFYLSDDKPVKIIVKNRMTGDPEFKDKYSGETVPDEYKNYYKKYTNRAAAIATMFNSIDAAAVK
ncbi:MAG: hypothetical protein IIU03_05000 [Bacteroidales bacterium]|nr:hypothetical protein [Bacteroidales bacterium]